MSAIVALLAYLLLGYLLIELFSGFYKTAINSKVAHSTIHYHEIDEEEEEEEEDKHPRRKRS